MSELLPDKFWGIHIDSPEQLVDITIEILRRQTSVNPNQRIHFDNAGEIRAYEDSADQKVVLLVPLPHLDFADVTTDELHEALAMTMPAGVRLEVDVAPPPNDS